MRRELKESKATELRREVEYLMELADEREADGHDASSIRTEIGHAKCELAMELESASKRNMARIKARLRRAINREMLDSLGILKVRGNLGGTYYE